MSSVTMSRTIDGSKRISDMSQADLMELVKRLQDVLRNTKIVEKLNDKGQRIKDKLSAAEEELARRETLLRHTSDQLERMCIQDSANDSSTDSAPKSDELEFPKFCMKLSEYEKHRIERRKFKPFSTVKNKAEIKPDGSLASETPKEYPADTSQKGLSTLSFEDSLKIAAMKQNITKRLFREDAATFRLESAAEISFSQKYRPTEEYLKYREDQENSDSDDESPDREQVGNGLEELD